MGIRDLAKKYQEQDTGDTGDAGDAQGSPLNTIKSRVQTITGGNATARSIPTARNVVNKPQTRVKRGL